MADDTWWLSEDDLDDDQQAVIDLPLVGSHLLLGPPGSGKTNLLLLRASFLSKNQRPNWAIIMFNRPLRDFVARAVDHYEIDPKKIVPIISYEMKFLSEHGVRFDDIQTIDLVARRAEFAKRGLELIQKKPGLKGHLDCVFVDEVQDCLPVELDLLRKLGQQVFFAGDHRQKLYATPDDLSTLKTVLQTIELKFHYRTGQNICRAADAVSATSGEEPITPTSKYDETRAPSSVTFTDCPTLQAQADAISARIRTQLRTYPGELIGVACPRRQETQAIRDALVAQGLEDQLIDDEHLSDASLPGHVFVDTMHSLKGLEFRCVHLAGLEHISSLQAQQKRAAFTAFTRTKTALACYFTGHVPGYLEKAGILNTKNKAKVAIKDLFPKKPKR